MSLSVLHYKPLVLKQASGIGLEKHGISQKTWHWLGRRVVTISF